MLFKRNLSVAVPNAKTHRRANWYMRLKIGGRKGYVTRSTKLTIYEDAYEYAKSELLRLQQASKLVLEANTFEESSIYHLDMGKPQNIYQMAKNLIKLYGYQPVTSSREENNYSRLLTVIGLQKGEKLYEELLIDQKSQPTINKEIFASIENIDLEKTKILLKEVNLYLDKSDKELLHNILSNKLINYIKQK